MKIAIILLVSSLLCVVLHGQMLSGTFVKGSLVNAKQRIPTTFFDSFNRAAASPMTTTATDTDGTPNAGVWTSGEGTLDDCALYINLLFGVALTESGCRVLSPLFRPDQSATLVAGSPTQTGVMLRVKSPTDCSGYLAFIDDPTHVSIYRVVDNGGTFTYVPLGAINNVVATINNVDTFTFSIQGTTMDVFVNGVSLGLTRIDSTYTQGQPGIYFYGGGSIVEFSATEL